jgi:hypothetical protein
MEIEFTIVKYNHAIIDERIMIHNELKQRLLNNINKFQTFIDENKQEYKTYNTEKFRMSTRGHIKLSTNERLMILGNIVDTSISYIDMKHYVGEDPFYSLLNFNDFQCYIHVTNKQRMFTYNEVTTALTWLEDITSRCGLSVFKRILIRQLHISEMYYSSLCENLSSTLDYFTEWLRKKRDRLFKVEVFSNEEQKINITSEIIGKINEFGLQSFIKLYPYVLTIFNMHEPMISERINNNYKRKQIMALKTTCNASIKETNLNNSNSFRCAKIWWREFLRQNPYVHKLWRSLPLPKAGYNNRLRRQEENSTIEECIITNLSTANSSPKHEDIFTDKVPVNDTALSEEIMNGDKDQDKDQDDDLVNKYIEAISEEDTPKLMIDETKGLSCINDNSSNIGGSDSDNNDDEREDLSRSQLILNSNELYIHRSTEGGLERDIDITISRNNSSEPILWDMLPYYNDRIFINNIHNAAEDNMTTGISYDDTLEDFSYAYYQNDFSNYEGILEL